MANSVPKSASRAERARRLTHVLLELDRQRGEPAEIENAEPGMSLRMFKITEQLRGSVVTGRTIPRYLRSRFGELTNHPLPITNHTVQVFAGTETLFAAQLIGRKFRLLIFNQGPWVNEVLSRAQRL